MAAPWMSILFVKIAEVMVLFERMSAQGANGFAAVPWLSILVWAPAMMNSRRLN
jgi:hypothetical protein